jgi:pimeloyl-ACP methyl ester carboxylesterase
VLLHGWTACVGPVIAVGFSMGGPIALHLARRHPHLVEGLVLAATTLAFNTTHLSRLHWGSLPLIGAALRWDVGLHAVERIVDQVGALDEEVAAWRDHLIGEAKRGSPVDVVGAGRALRSWDARPWASELGLPTATVVTVGDRLVQPRRQREMASQLGALVVEVDGDHDVFLRGSPAFAASILAATEAVSARLRGGARPGYQPPVGANGVKAGGTRSRRGRRSLPRRLVARLRGRRSAVTAA